MTLKNMQEEIKKIMEESIETKRKFAEEAGNIKLAAKEIIKCFLHGNKLLICGNGGSAADAQHLTAEFIEMFEMRRRPLPAIALTTNTSNLTSIGNYEGYEFVFSRQIEALAKKGDVLIGLSTSGTSKNVVRALEKGKEVGAITISFTGRDGGKLKPLSQVNINCSSTKTGRIQECHELAYHIICKLVEQELFAKEGN